MTLSLTPAGLHSYRKTTNSTPICQTKNDPKKSRSKAGKKSTSSKTFDKAKKDVNVELGWGKK